MSFLKRRILIFSLISLFLLFFKPQLVCAETIKNFDVSLTAHKNGDMSIREVIQYDFDLNPKHGIYRSIPLVSQVGNLYRIISVKFTQILMDGQHEHYIMTSSADNVTQVKIGDPNIKITGIHTYIIDYDVSNGIGSNYTDHDEIYWNVTGNEWVVPIEKASFSIKTDFGQNPGDIKCFTGRSGSMVGNCVFQNLLDGKKITTTVLLNSYEGFSVVTSFPVNTFPKSILQKDRPFFSSDFINSLKILIPAYLFVNFFLVAILIYWYTKHKRKNRFGPVEVNFDSPKYPNGERVIPAEAGTIDNTKLETDDLVATIVDLAIRRYLRIEQIIGEKNYKLIKLKEFTDLSDFEKTLMTAIIGQNQEVSTKDVQLEYTDFDNLLWKNYDSLIAKGVYTKNPQLQMSLLFLLGLICIFTFNIFLGSVLIFLSRKLNGRTAIGDELDWKIDGLKLFLKGMSREYGWLAEKAYLVEQMIPYAIALGYIDQYMKQIKILNPNFQTSGWYVGNDNFYLIYPSLIHSFNNAVTVATSSSSGFSGGFSGGGGGGGGGGSW